MTTPHTSFEALMPEPEAFIAAGDLQILRYGMHSIAGARTAPDDLGLYTADQMREAIRAATEAAAKKEWQPIETAPKDGTKFLALRRDEIAIAWLLVRDDGDIWNFGRTSACSEVFPSIVPTHWMPLPAAPVAAAIRASGGKGEAS